MKKIYLSFVLFSFIAISVLSQTPQAINYQAIARDDVGNVIADQDVSLRISILEGSASGIVVYSETHIVHTNLLGLLNIEIGNGIPPITGNFSLINWGNNTFFIKTEMDATGGSAYVFMGASQLLSVPYSLFSENTANIDDADADPVNEIQTLSKTGSTIELSDGGGTVNDDVDDADNNATNELQTLSKTGSTIELSDGGGTVNDDVDDADNNPANELQTLSKSGTNVTLSNGGGTVSIADNDNNATNELQTISKSGSTVTLSDGGGSFTDAVNDADISPINELQSLSLSGNNLTISNGNTIGLPAGLPTGSLGKTLYHNGSSWLANTNLYNNGSKVGIGTTTPTDRLHIYDSGNDGDVTIEDSFPFLTFDATSTSGNAGLIFKEQGEYRGWITYKNPEEALYISAANASTAFSHIVVETGGDVGIGTASPDRKLTVNGTVGINDYLYHNGDADTRMYLLTDGMEFTVGNEKLIDLYEGTQDVVKLGDGGDVDINLNDVLFVQGSNGNVGIGTTNPYYPIHVVTNTVARGIFVSNTYDGTSSKYGMYNTISSTGTGIRYGIYNYVYANSTDASSSYGARFYVNSNSSPGTTYGIYASTSTSGTGSHWAAYFPTGNTYVGGELLVGTTNGAAGYKVSVDGKIMCEELRVELSGSWPDYVFDNEYQLMSLKDLEKNIKKNKHLPGLPSAKSVEENGIMVGEMTQNLIQKVEELTLYIIELNNYTKELNKKVEKLEKENKGLKDK